MDVKEWNANRLSMTDVIKFTVGQLEQDHGVKIPAGKAKDLFIEAVLRNVVVNEIADMMLFIADEAKYDAVHYPKEGSA